MKMYLACAIFDGIEDLFCGADILIAYPYITKFKRFKEIYPKMRNFMLDSGVFTMINSGKRFSLDKYMEEYAQFIKENNICQYIELDVDQIIGVKKTRLLRQRLEDMVGWKSIPVWHTIRGKESFIEDCKEYDYIALGYFLTEGLKASITEKYAKAFIDKAHELDCRIHGLGFTKISIKELGFDSVDSSNWAAGDRFGQIQKFDATNQKMLRENRIGKQRLINSAFLRRPNFIEWRKYQDYAYKYFEPIWQ